MTWLSGCSSLESCCQRTHAWCSQVFYRTHIIAFVAFMVFGFIHHYQLWAYTMPGEASLCHTLRPAQLPLIDTMETIAACTVYAGASSSCQSNMLLGPMTDIRGCRA